MKKMLTVLALMLVIFLCSTVQALDGGRPHEILGQLPANKEMLFHQTMRQVWDGTKNINEEIKGLEREIKSVLTASDFNEALFLEKMSRLQELHRKVREAMDAAIAKLASQFNAAERNVLAELISRKPGPPPGR